VGVWKEGGKDQIDLIYMRFWTGRPRRFATKQ
jgi:hypothetical protein